MKVRIKSQSDKPSVGAIKILQQHTPFSLEEIRSRFVNHEPIFEFDTLEDEKEVATFQLINELKQAEVLLEFYEYFGDDEILVDENMIRNLFQRARDISEQMDREDAFRSNSE
ncbi:hypothetical protein [Fluviicola taffensis]|uniref:hypothetical protein n=1 Tax=Fluviicola taffensis TaxID=191579 RepID=UPI0031384252